MFKYTYKTRGFSIGCQPKGFVEVKQEEHEFETLYYDRELTKEEIEEFELIDLNTNNQKKYKINIKEILSRTIEIEAENELEALEIVLEQYNQEEIILDDSDYSGHPIIERVKK